MRMATTERANMRMATTKRAKEPEPFITEEPENSSKLWTDFERKAFEFHNEARANPQAAINKIRQQLNSFQGTKYLDRRLGMYRPTHEGTSVWNEAISALER